MTEFKRLTIGILGGGQLAQMMALAGIPMGFHFRVFDPSPKACAQICAEHVCAEYDDEDALEKFSEGLEVVTYEFENVPTDALDFLEKRVPIHPNRAALKISQDRLLEKEFFKKLLLPVGKFWQIDSAENLAHALEECPEGILKTRRFGYDGKGQMRLNGGDADKIWKEFGEKPAVFEKLIDFDREVSVIAAHNEDGDLEIYPLFENRHKDGILDTTLFPAPNSAKLEKQATFIIKKVMTELKYYGVLAIELFVTGDQLTINEMAPRVHNSGHITTEAAMTSQFENQIRAVMNLPLGSAKKKTEGVMFNIIGSALSNKDYASVPNSTLHLYGKDERDGRKLGHLSVLTEEGQTLEDLAESISS